MEHIKDKTFAIVDIETSGSSPTHDRIIEVGVLRIENGAVVKTYQTLVNPQTSIPDTIRMITGIHPDELVTAPLFEEIYAELQELLHGAIFVAHNARFDYGFIKNEFKRVGIPFNAKCLCTVRLSRKLYPRHKRHDLSTLIERHSFTCDNRHRAFDDAKVLWDFLQAAHTRKGEDLRTAIDELLQQNTLPQFLNEHAIRNLPERPGVYIFYGQDSEVLYVGKSRNIRFRVLSHFSNDHTTTKEMNICQQTARIETRETSGELGALLLESQLVKTLNPLYNRQLRRKTELVIARKEITADYPRVTLERTSSITPEDYPHVVGVFRSVAQGKDYFRDIAKEYGLCHKLLGLEKTKSRCFASQIGICRGACAGLDDPTDYNERFDRAFERRRIQSWPFDGFIIIEEKKDDTEKHSFILNNWCLLGDIRTTEDDTEFISLSPEFDYDSYKIFARYLSNPSYRRTVRTLSQREYNKIFNQHASFHEERVVTIN